MPNYIDVQFEKYIENKIRRRVRKSLLMYGIGYTVSMLATMAVIKILFAPKIAAASGLAGMMITATKPVVPIKIGSGF